MFVGRCHRLLHERGLIIEINLEAVRPDELLVAFQLLLESQDSA